MEPPTIEEHDGILVVRDDLTPGGTKARVLHVLLGDAEELVYASPAYGYAQVALAHVCSQHGRRATVFTAKRNRMHPRTEEAKAAGARIVMVPTGYLSNVTAKARAYCDATGATLLPWGLDVPQISDALAAEARALDIHPAEVWTVAGSGTLTRALQAAWPEAAFHAVLVGAEADVGRATPHRAPESFEQDAREPPPFPSCSNYDAKAWRFIRQHATPGALFWNVAG